jgi:membrane protein DedA with SNARE-associated domain
MPLLFSLGATIPAWCNGYYIGWKKKKKKLKKKLLSKTKQKMKKKLKENYIKTA